MKEENPLKQLNYLQQCLSSDKKPIGILLGAGCPTAIKIGGDKKEPLIPDIDGITRIICEQLNNCKDCGSLHAIIEEHFKKDCRNNVTVEDILTHIRALRAVAGKETVRGLSAKDLDLLDDKICQLIYEIVNKNLPDSETPYNNMASWINAINRENSVEIFTSNYDLLVEQALENSQVPYFDGFAGSRKPFFDLIAVEEDTLPARWAKLWKIHGSINWYQLLKKGVFRGTILENAGAKRVIHPSHLKYQESRRMPYLAMMDRLRSFLKKPTATLLICGYSFKDEHINEVIVQGLQSTQTAIAFALLYGKLDTYKQAISLAKQRTNLNILAFDRAIISGQVSKWTEKAAEAISEEDKKWIIWTPTDSTKENGNQSAEFTLGDFVMFGKFLQELTGHVPETAEAEHA
ncbi:MAG: SIR2 family protein [Chitinispirillaceae bacterium]|jgi:hypothetical protein